LHGLIALRIADVRVADVAETGVQRPLLRSAPAAPHSPRTMETQHMTTTSTQTLAGRLIGRVSEIWSELDYAQRRLFELRTGVPVEDKRPRSRSASRTGGRGYQERAWDEFSC
jgi:hypothetical protein